MKKIVKENILLIGSDTEENKKIEHMLSTEYQLVIVKDMEAGLENLTEKGRFQAVLLDAFVPDESRKYFLKELNKDKYSHPPVIALLDSSDRNTRRDTLLSGADEFVIKPLDATVLFNRIKSVIARSNLFKMDDNKYELKYDSLTGLYNRHTMYLSTRKMLDDNKNVNFCVIILDINKFSLYNSTLGEREGDRLLCFIADAIEDIFEQYELCTYGRVGGDVYCICEPYDDEIVRHQIGEIKKRAREFRDDYLVEIAAGVYIVEDSTVSIEAMFTRARMAAHKNKSDYLSDAKVYDENMEKKASSEQIVINEMQRALSEQQFIIYLQPKCSLKTGEAFGAEALVRWKHPERGILSPGLFIPVFEKNGFITKIDYFMWDSVCKLIRRWIDDGIEPMPVSVNMSRVSMYNPGVSELLEGLVNKYNISPSLVNIEITESAYMDNPNLMKDTLVKLKKAGFTVMMDDFGSGYSSLNTLKDFDVDVIKIDMKFLPKNDNRKKGEKILSSVVEMVEGLEMDSIIEGVETKEQKEYLEGIGCDYGQGYYFSKPIPVEDYEKKYLKIC